MNANDINSKLWGDLLNRLDVIKRSGTNESDLLLSTGECCAVSIYDFEKSALLTLDNLGAFSGLDPIYNVPGLPRAIAGGLPGVKIIGYHVRFASSSSYQNAIDKCRLGMKMGGMDKLPLFELRLKGRLIEIRDHELDKTYHLHKMNLGSAATDILGYMFANESFHVTNELLKKHGIHFTGGLDDIFLKLKIKGNLRRVFMEVGHGEVSLQPYVYQDSLDTVSITKDEFRNELIRIERGSQTPKAQRVARSSVKKSKKV